VLRDKPGYGHDTRPLILVRGVDRCGKNDFKRGHPRAAAQGTRLAGQRPVSRDFLKWRDSDAGSVIFPEMLADASRT
jgi:hypothetical protein